MILALIVEDNLDDAKILQSMLHKISLDFTFVLCEDGDKAIQYVKRSKQEVSIFFVDRELPKMDGFSFASEIRSMDKYVLTPIVFVTGYEMNQLDAFQEYHCYSYLLKPLSLELVKKQIGPLLMNLEKKEKGPALHKVINVKTREGEYLIRTCDILGLEVVGKNCYLHTLKKQYMIQRCGLEKEMEEINDPNLIRCHKSFALNLINVLHIEKKRRNIWAPCFKGDIDRNFEISKTYYDSVIEQHKKLLQGGNGRG